MDTNTTIDNTIVAKLKKLLTLNRDATGAEAETALVMATKLATKYEIDIASIELETGVQKKEEMVNSDKSVGPRLPVTQKWVSWLLQNCFNVSLVYSGSRWGGRRICFLGRKSDVEFAKYVNDFLNEHMLRSWQYYQKTNKVDTRYRASYFHGFYEGLKSKLTEAKKNQQTESLSTVSKTVADRYALTIVDEEKARKDFVSQQFTSLRNVRSYTRTYHNSDVNGAGVAAGRSTVIARPLK